MAGVMNLGRGVAFRIESTDLMQIRESLAEAFWDYLIPQDRAAWRPHITIQNKVSSHDARALFTALQAEFRPRPIEIAGLAVFRYMNGPWDAIGAWRLGNGAPMQAPSPQAPSPLAS